MGRSSQRRGCDRPHPIKRNGLDAHRSELGMSFRGSTCPGDLPAIALQAPRQRSRRIAKAEGEKTRHYWLEACAAKVTFAVISTFWASETSAVSVEGEDEIIGIAAARAG